jgi:hypothetical protein
MFIFEKILLSLYFLLSGLFCFQRFFVCPYCSVSSGGEINYDYIKNIIYGPGILFLSLIFAGVLVFLTFFHYVRNDRKHKN